MAQMKWTDFHRHLLEYCRPGFFANAGRSKEKKCDRGYAFVKAGNMEPIELSVVILCYRTGRRAYNFVERTIKMLEKHVKSWEIVLVGNYFENSGDDTPEVVREIARRNKHVRALTLKKAGMMGWDARTGMNAASGDYICVIDGDEQMPPRDIIRVFNKITTENLDLVLTHRVKRFDGFLRTANSKMYNFIANALFPGVNVKDINSKPKILKREVYNHMRLSADDWFFDAEMMIEAKRLRINIGQIPTLFYKNESRRSFVKLPAIFEFIVNLFNARIRRPFKPR